MLQGSVFVVADPNSPDQWCGPDPDPHQSDKLVEDPDPHQSEKLDPDPHQFADDKPKCIEYEPRFWGFIWLLRSGSASKWKVGSGSASKWQAGSRSASESLEHNGNQCSRALQGVFVVAEQQGSWFSYQELPDPNGPDQCCGPDPDPHQSDKLDKPKCIECEPILTLFQGFEPLFGI
jgi:hypothetical protein